MKRLVIVCDYPGWTDISEIADEMDTLDLRFSVQHPELAALHTPLEPLLLSRFSDLDVDLCFCFRCLEKSSNWVSKARMYKNDSEYSFAKNNNILEASRTLGMDIAVYREDFEAIKKDRAAQRLILGTELWRFLQVTLPKYKNKIPITKEEITAILSMIQTWLIEHQWIES